MQKTDNKKVIYVIVKDNNVLITDGEKNIFVPRSEHFDYFFRSVIKFDTPKKARAYISTLNKVGVGGCEVLRVSRSERTLIKKLK